MESGLTALMLILSILRDQFTLQHLVKQEEVYIKLIGQHTHAHAHLLEPAEVLLHLGPQPFRKIGLYLPLIALFKMVVETMMISVTLELLSQVIRSMPSTAFIQLEDLIQLVTQKVLSHFPCQVNKNLLDMYLLLRNGLSMLPSWDMMLTWKDWPVEVITVLALFTSVTSITTSTNSTSAQA